MADAYDDYDAPAQRPEPQSGMDDERRRWQRMPRDGSARGVRQARIAVASDPAPMLSLPSVPVMPAVPSQSLNPTPAYNPDDPPDRAGPSRNGTSGTAKRPRAPKAPQANTSSGKHRTLLSGVHPRINTPKDAWDTDSSLYASADDEHDAAWGASDSSDRRRLRARTPARPLTLAAAIAPTTRNPDETYNDDSVYADGYDGYNADADYDPAYDPDYDDGDAAGYGAHAPARRDLTPSTALTPLSTESVPDLIAFRPPIAAMQRSRVRSQTQALVKSARSPWSIVRVALALTALVIAVFSATGHMGEPAQPLLANFQTSGGVTSGSAIASLVRPETQGKRPDLYDSSQQFNDWWDAACSAAVTSEVLTAYGAPNATIGHMIDEMVPDISPNGGLLSYHGFTRAAQKNGFRADFYTTLTNNQMLYITNQLGLPVIVNVRVTYGYYHFLSGGHFLIIVGGDSQGVSIVDSSEYYIHYLPWSVFDSMFTHHEVLIVPKSYTYNLPPS
ncbi:MAG: hypothetical protein ABI068_06600 [Ktedonobacterales bacterium]